MAETTPLHVNVRVRIEPVRGAMLALPLRERIAEALHPIPEWPDIFCSETPEAARERHRAEGLRLADAVLADLPDTAVIAAIKAAARG